MPNATRPAAVALAGPALEPLEALGQVPRVLGLAAEPAIALGELAGGELGEEDGAGVAEHFNDAGVFVDHLVLVGGGAPGGLVAFDRDDVFGAPRNAVQRPFVAAGRDLAIGLFGLRARDVVKEGDDAVEGAVVLVQPRQVHLGELGRGDLAGPDERRELH